MRKERKKIEADRILAEERKSQLVPKQEIPLVEPSSSQPERYILEQKPPRVKTRGVGTESEVLEEGT